MGGAPVVNLRYLSLTGDKNISEGINPVHEDQDRRHQKSKRRAPMTLQNSPYVSKQMLRPCRLYSVCAININYLHQNSITPNLFVRWEPTINIYQLLFKTKEEINYLCGRHQYHY